MQIIYPDNISSVSADEENANFPATNIQTDYIKEVWKATSVDARLTLVITSAKGAALFGCNADSVVVTILTGLDGVWGGTGDGHVGVSWGGTGDGHVGVSWGISELGGTTQIYDLAETGLGALWIDYVAEITVQHTMHLDFTGTSTIEVGVAKAGDITTFRDPTYGIKEGLHDYSIRRELSNGAWYIKPRDIVRTFDLQLILERDDDFYNFMHKIYLLRGSQPLAWRISNNLTNFEWIVYARAIDMPQGSHDYPDDSIINISLIEVI